MNKLKISKILFTLIPLFIGINNIEAMQKENCKSTILNESNKNVDVLQYFKDKGIEAPTIKDLNIIANLLLYQKMQILILKDLIKNWNLKNAYDYIVTGTKLTNLSYLLSIDNEKSAINLGYGNMQVIDNKIIKKDHQNEIELINSIKKLSNSRVIDLAEKLVPDFFSILQEIEKIHFKMLNSLLNEESLKSHINTIVNIYSPDIECKYDNFYANILKHKDNILKDKKIKGRLTTVTALSKLLILPNCMCTDCHNKNNVENSYKNKFAKIANAKLKLPNPKDKDFEKELLSLIDLFMGIKITNKPVVKQKESELDYSAKEQNKIPKVKLKTPKRKKKNALKKSAGQGKKTTTQSKKEKKERNKLHQAIINFDPTSETECSQELESMAFNVLGYPSDNKTLNENSYAILFNVYRSLNQELEKLDESAETESYLELKNKIQKIEHVLIEHLTQGIKEVDASYKEEEEQKRKNFKQEELVRLAKAEQDALNEQKLKALREKQRLEEEQIKIEQRLGFLYEKYLKDNKPTYHERLFKNFLDLNKTFKANEIRNDTALIFNESKNRFESKNIFYHTYSPILDIFIKKHHHNKQIAQERDGGLRRIYQCPGFITWQRMANKPAMFEIAFVSDVSNKCYHRGYKLLSSIDITLSPEQRAKLTDEDSYEEITLDALNEGPIDKRIYQDISFKENEYFIKVQDTRNNATLILIKPLENSN